VNQSTGLPQSTRERMESDARKGDVVALHARRLGSLEAQFDLLLGDLAGALLGRDALVAVDRVVAEARAQFDAQRLEFAALVAAARAVQEVSR
jgi:hypothetical protein